MNQTMPSLLDSLDLPGPASNAPSVPMSRRLTDAITGPFRRRIGGWWARVKQDPPRRRRAVRAFWALGSVAVIGLGVGAYFVFRPVPQPDYLDGDLDEVLGYTLLTDEFNKLPIDQRLKLIGDLVGRLKNMSAGDSVLMASFAAGLAGAARDQLMENGSRLAVDTWDKFASDYDKVEDGKREEFVDKSFVDFTKMMEAIGGQPRNISDEERLAEGKRQAQRDMKNMSDPERRPPGEAMGRMFTFMNQDVGRHANPQQRVRGQQLMRDMTRRLRGEDLSTGKPLPGATPAPKNGPK